jgi:hypothetical protein
MSVADAKWLLKARANKLRALEKYLRSVPEDRREIAPKIAELSAEIERLWGGIPVVMRDTTMKTGIARIDEQQERERIAAAERKRTIAVTPEVIEAFMNGDDRRNPAPTPRRDGSRDE